MAKKKWSMREVDGAVGGATAFEASKKMKMKKKTGGRAVSDADAKKGGRAVSDADVIGEAVAMAKKKKKDDDKAAMDHFKKTGLPLMSKKDKALLENMKNKGGSVKKYARGGGVRAARF
jgi:hypothetical protein